MKKADRKYRILHFLESQSGWFAISEILGQLGTEFKERTVRRLLSELRDNDKLIEQKGGGRNICYRSIATNHQTLINAALARIVNKQISADDRAGLIIAMSIDNGISDSEQQAFIASVEEALGELRADTLMELGITRLAFEQWRKLKG